ncbi:Fc.00g025470.m01.CDS01 [Cosmosporella sp. VM-42]
MQSQSLHTVCLSVAGQPGQDGTRFWDKSNDQEAPRGRPGRHGRDSSYPTAGTTGGEISVLVHYSPERPGLVQVRGEEHFAGRSWEVSPVETLLLDCHGGNGGHGGIGGNGQPGGRGESGINATQHSNATNGRPGYRGGDAGKGTDGARAGNAGHAYITVDESDMDTLIALNWDVTGGVGGEGGAHGVAGRGGRGGPGGAGCSWTERQIRSWTDSYGNTQSGYYDTYHSRPPGWAGPNGPSGRNYTTTLSAGQGGEDGFCQIKVIRDCSKDEICTGRYQLVVRSFDVIDENDDGINEPGEFLLVTNIVVENIGDMRSPRKNTFKILIRPTAWLEPVTTEPLELPLDIPSRTSAIVPGVLRAFIRNEYEPRAAGTIFCAKDTVSLMAHSERLQRCIPEFAGAQRVVYQYPIVMNRPRFLDCVAKGDRVKFSWMIKNVSTKVYGNSGSLRRPAGTCISDPGGVFELASANLGSSHEVIHPVEILEPGTEICVSQYLTVSELVPAFSVGQMTVGLALSDPHNTQLPRTIVYFLLSIQISPVYRFNPAAHFLLVVNASTPNAAILQLINFVERGLHLSLDIFNLSLVGSLTSPVTRQSLFSSYVGKSIVIFANTTSYFQDGTREPWDLMDSWEVCLLAKAGTSFVFIHPTNINDLKNWAHQMILPAYALPQLKAEESLRKPSEVLKRLTQMDSATDTTEKCQNLVVKKRILRSLESRLSSEAESIQKRLDKRLPLRRFLVCPCDEPLALTDHEAAGIKSAPKVSAVAIFEGLPHHVKVVASFPPQDGINKISDQIATMVVHAFPYSDQCRVFWNVLSLEYSTSIRTEIAYRGDDLAHLLSGSGFAHESEKGTMVDRKVFDAMTWSITAQISSEISHFCRKSPWPDCYTSKSKILSELPLLDYFIKSAPVTLSLDSDESFFPLTTVLGRVIGVLRPLSVGQWIGQNIIRVGNRKTKIRGMLLRELSPLLKALCTPEYSNKAAKRTRELAVETKKSLARIKKVHPNFDRVDRARELDCEQLGLMTDTAAGGGFIDLGDLAGLQGSAHLNREGLSERRRLHAEHLAKRDRDTAWSKQMLAEMVDPMDQGSSMAELEDAAGCVDRGPLEPVEKD